MHILHPRRTNITIADITHSDRTNQILSELTTSEKVSLLTARDFSTTRDIPRLNIPSLKVSIVLMCLDISITVVLGRRPIVLVR